MLRQFFEHMHIPLLVFPSLLLLSIQLPLSTFGFAVALVLGVSSRSTLTEESALPTCRHVFNIYHPYDPLAYRLDLLVNASAAKEAAFLIPHHQGRKRMHLGKHKYFCLLFLHGFL